MRKDKEETYTHESYGMLGFYRTYGGNKTLFGSSIKHDNTIVLRLKTAKMSRTLNSYHYYGKKELFEVEMSYSQFCELIANMNSGDGIPVTIRAIDGKLLEPPPFEDVRQVFESEFKEAMADSVSEIREAIAKVEELIESKKNFTQADKKEILNHLMFAERQMGGSTSEFIYNMFNEQMDKTVAEAKGEVEAFVDNKIHALGLESLQQLNKDLSIEEKNDNDSDSTE